MNHHVFPLLIVLAATVSCGGEKPESSGTTAEKDLDTVLVARGEADAAQVMQLPERSQEREAAILEIRARESRLRRAGMDRSADSYHAGAARLLDRLSSETE